MTEGSTLLRLSREKGTNYVTLYTGATSIRVPISDDALIIFMEDVVRAGSRIQREVPVASKV